VFDQVKTRHQPFDPNLEDLRDAKQGRYRDSAAGFYALYLRLMKPVLNKSFWGCHLVLDRHVSDIATIAASSIDDPRAIKSLDRDLIAQTLQRP